MYLLLEELKCENFLDGHISFDRNEYDDALKTIRYQMALRLPVDQKRNYLVEFWGKPRQELENHSQVFLSDFASAAFPTEFPTGVPTTPSVNDICIRHHEKGLQVESNIDDVAFIKGCKNIEYYACDEEWTQFGQAINAHVHIVHEEYYAANGSSPHPCDFSRSLHVFIIHTTAEYSVGHYKMVSWSKKSLLRTDLVPASVWPILGLDVPNECRPAFPSGFKEGRV
jgi:hypothetical protein